MELLALIEGDGHVCYRYRVEAFTPQLDERGWHVVPLALAGGSHSMSALLVAARQADAVLLQRKLLSTWQLWRLRRAAKVLLFDFDDAVFLRDSNSAKSPHSLRRGWRFRNILRVADAITAGNSWLCDQAGSHGAGGEVHHFPTCVQPELYRPAEHWRLGREARLVWIGSRSTAPSLKAAQPALEAAADELGGLQLRLVSDTFPAIGRVTVEPRPWSQKTETTELSEADIGISWLPDHPWSVGKCGLKVLQYMAAGLPVVANPVGMNSVLVQHGETGLLAATAGEWARAIAGLANDPELRLRLGQAGRRMVCQHFAASDHALRFASLLDRLAAGSRNSGSGVQPAPIRAA